MQRFGIQSAAVTLNLALYNEQDVTVVLLGIAQQDLESTPPNSMLDLGARAFGMHWC